MRVVYIGGLGRSGSTLLERSLAQLPDACGLGEVVYLWERGIREDQRCGCGTAFSRCPFWTQVGDEAFGGWSQVDVDRITYLRDRVDDVRHVPRLLLPADRGGLEPELSEYRSYYERLYAAAAKISGAQTVVDSSKVTSLAYVLAHSPDLDLRLIHILRDPRAVAYAWTKVVSRPDIDHQGYLERFSPSYMSALFVGHHGLLEALRLRRVPSTRVRYEDFADQPAQELRRLAEFAGLRFDADAVLGETPHQLRLDVVHTVSGNPSRFDTGVVTVRRDEKWRSAMPSSARRISTLITAPAMLGYRYPRPASSAAAEPAMPSQLADLPEPPEWPSVTVVVPTHDRPELVRRSLASIAAQDYAGDLDVVVVFDRNTPDLTLASDAPGRLVRVVANTRTPGLAGARNTGILQGDGDLVAFLDDDDWWLSSKLTRQVSHMLADPAAIFSTTAMSVEYEDRSIPRTAGSDQVTHLELLRSRMAMLHSSSFLADRGALGERIGLVDETMPRSMAEDWDLLLRAAAVRPIRHLDEPLIKVQWGPNSFFADQWQQRNDAHQWLLEHHPAMAQDAKAAGLMFGKLAFGSAMFGERARAWQWMRKAFRADPRQPRTVLAALVALRLVSGPWLMEQLNKRGRGI